MKIWMIAIIAPEVHPVYGMVRKPLRGRGGCNPWSIAYGHRPAAARVGISNTNPVPFASWWQLMQLVANAAVLP